MKNRHFKAKFKMEIIFERCERHFPERIQCIKRIFLCLLHIFDKKKNVCFLSRYLALESMCLLATSEFSHEAVKKHQETVVTSLKVRIHGVS